jgi:hypothetical protein
MDFDQVPRGALIAGISGVLLFIFMFLSWFGAPDAGVITPAGQELDFSGLAEAAGVDTTLNAWQAFDFIDLVMLLAIIAAIGLLVMSAMGTSINLPVAASAIVTALGALATLLVLYRIIDPVFDADREFGLFLGLLACAGIAVGGWLAMQEEGTSFGDLGSTGGTGGYGGTGTGGYNDPGAQAPPPGHAPPPGQAPPPPPAGGTQPPPPPPPAR